MKPSAPVTRTRFPVSLMKSRMAPPCWKRALQSTTRGIFGFHRSKGASSIAPAASTDAVQTATRAPELWRESRSAAPQAPGGIGDIGPVEAVRRGERGAIDGHLHVGALALALGRNRPSGHFDVMEYGDLCRFRGVRRPHLPDALEGNRRRAAACRLRLRHRLVGHELINLLSCHAG